MCWIAHPTQAYRGGPVRLPHTAERERTLPPNPWYHEGLRFECTRCGRCCTGRGEYAYVYLTREDLARLARHLGLSPAEAAARHCARDGPWWVLRSEGPACRFLDAEGGCAVYAARPMQCRTWPFWRDNLERERWEGPVRETCPGIGSGPLYPREEVERLAEATEAWYEAAWDEEPPGEG